MKKMQMFFLILIVGGYSFSSDIESELLGRLRERIIIKPIFEYLEKNNYHGRFPSPYSAYGTDGRYYELREAFKIEVQPENEKVCGNVQVIERYIYYGFEIEVYKIPNGQNKYFYLASVEITGSGMGYEILLFDKNGQFLDDLFMALQAKWWKKRSLIFPDETR